METQGRPGPPRSLSGLRPQSFQLLGKNRWGPLFAGFNRQTCHTHLVTRIVFACFCFTSRSGFRWVGMQHSQHHKKARRIPRGGECNTPDLIARSRDAPHGQTNRRANKQTKARFVSLLRTQPSTQGQMMQVEPAAPAPGLHHAPQTIWCFRVVKPCGIQLPSVASRPRHSLMRCREISCKTQRAHGQILG